MSGQLMEATATRLEHALAKDTNGLPLLGHILTWSIGCSLVDARVLETLLRTHGLTPYAPLPIRPKTAMRRALAEMTSGQLIRRVQDTFEYSMFVVKNERQVPGIAQADALPDLEYTTDLKMVWYKLRGQDPDKALAFSDESRGRAFRVSVRKYLTGYLPGDISLVGLRAVKFNRGITLRQAGGVYFLPIYQQDVLANLRAFFADLRTLTVRGTDETFISAFAIPNDENERIDLAVHVAQDINADIKRLSDDLRELEARVANPKARGTASATVSKYLATASALSDKASFYADLLRESASGVDDHLAVLTERLRRLLRADLPF